LNQRCDCAELNLCCTSLIDPTNQGFVGSIQFGLLNAWCPPSLSWVETMRGSSDHTLNGATRESQRPTLEQVTTDAREAETLKPPPARAARAALSVAPEVVAEAALRWAELQKGGQVPLELQLRYIVELLRALVPLHTNLRLPPQLRAYGKVSFENTRIQPDGSVQLAKEAEAVEASESLRAPELAQGELDQQADIYAVGAILMQMDAARGSSERGDALSDRVRSIARCALNLDPNARWASASEFADELEAAAGARLPAKAALFMFARDQLEVTAVLPSTPQAARALLPARVPALSVAPAALHSPPRDGVLLGQGALAISGAPPSLPRRAPWSRRRSALVAAGLALATLCGGFLLWFWASQRQEAVRFAEGSSLSFEPQNTPIGGGKPGYRPSPVGAEVIAEALPPAASPEVVSTALALPSASALAPAPEGPSVRSAAGSAIPSSANPGSAAPSGGTKRGVAEPPKKKSAGYEPEGI
jgi:hypothetical protein